MTDKQNTKDSRVIEIANYWLKKTGTSREDVLAHFGTKWHMPRRTLNRYVSKAKKYNETRMEIEQNAENDILVHSSVERLKSSLKLREEYLIELQNDFFRFGDIEGRDEIAAKRARAMTYKEIANTLGWNAPVKTAQTDSAGNDLPQTIEITMKL